MGAAQEIRAEVELLVRQRQDGGPDEGHACGHRLTVEPGPIAGHRLDGMPNGVAIV